MIFQYSLQRELNYTAGAVFMVMITVILTTMMIRILGFAAAGHADPRDILVLIGLTVVSYLAIILIITLFVSVLFVLTRWHKDSEMIIWFSSGLSSTDFILPVLRFSTPFIASIAFCALVAWPWANQHINLLKQRFTQRDDVAMITSGQFRESASNQRVFFVESISPNASHVHNVFVSGTENSKVNIVISKNGQIELTPNGDRYIILENGCRYDGEPDKPSYRVMEFERYGVKIENASHRSVGNAPTKSLSTNALLQDMTPIHQGEIVWRFGLPMLAINLVLLAIPLAHQNPRHGRTGNLVIAVLVYLSYSNLLSLSQAWVAQEKLSLTIGVWLLHAVVAWIIFIFYIRRTCLRGIFATLIHLIRSSKRAARS
ncbi:LPS export ABC transporter permease LptF [Candidatus Pandoraea novymonadis]|uniref:Lipopolysaccharide export system permease protein LptF n=1 Tax=Candidatus Pandoraea novymonadis TaxID=1808959 RepID=A0ABX5FFI9_9BURK|nr:LPS export ABC transporter permease LptF [Candidatus Pandoraea novymonadis]PSB92248.1 Lipopolysaccharide export system permease protein LptF [Candidatus Pandoraea novymonadis]